MRAAIMLSCIALSACAGELPTDPNTRVSGEPADLGATIDSVTARPMVLPGLTPSDSLPLGTSTHTNDLYGVTVRSGYVQGSIRGVRYSGMSNYIQVGVNYIDTYVEDSQRSRMHRVRFQSMDFDADNEVLSALTCEGPMRYNWQYDFTSYDATVAYEPIADGMRVHFDYYISSQEDYFSGYFDVMD